MLETQGRCAQLYATLLQELWAKVREGRREGGGERGVTCDVNLYNTLGTQGRCAQLYATLLQGLWGKVREGGREGRDDRRSQSSSRRDGM